MFWGENLSMPASLHFRLGHEVWAEKRSDGEADGTSDEQNQDALTVGCLHVGLGNLILLIVILNPCRKHYYAEIGDG
jgi:hypothetical protein